MSDGQEIRFPCTACGKRYRWKPELAGKKVKCKCGGVMHVPVQPPVEEVDDGLYDLAGDPEPPRRGAGTAAAPAPVTAAVDEDSQYRCPSCGKGLDAGAPICVHCGFNMKTGEKGAPRPVAAMAAPAAANAPMQRITPPSLSRQRQNAQDAASEGKNTKLILVGVAVVILIGAVFGIRMLLSGGKDTTPKPGDDAMIEEMIKDENGTEVVKWLEANKRNMVMGMTTAQAKGRAKILYDWGAKNVLAFGTGMTMSLAVELPDDPDQRKLIFDWQERWHGEMFEKVAKDVGQKYLLIKMRLSAG